MSRRMIWPVIAGPDRAGGQPVLMGTARPHAPTRASGGSDGAPAALAAGFLDTFAVVTAVAFTALTVARLLQGQALHRAPVTVLSRERR